MKENTKQTAEKAMRDFKGTFDKLAEHDRTPKDNMEERFREKFGHISNKGVQCDDTTVENILNFIQQEIAQACKEAREEQDNIVELYSKFMEDVMHGVKVEVAYNHYLESVDKTKSENKKGIMNKYNPNRPCPKCGHTVTKDTFSEILSTIERNCMNCGYTWSETPLDSEDKPQEEGYSPNWRRAIIHLNPETGEIHSDGDHSVGGWLRERIKPKAQEEK